MSSLILSNAPYSVGVVWGGVLAWFWLQTLDNRAVPAVLRPGIPDQASSRREGED